MSTTVQAPRETVLNVYADYQGWPRLFPTISGVRLLRREGPTLVLEVDHVQGKVVNELTVRPPAALDLWEEKRRYDARFLNRFEPVPGGTRFTVRGEIHLKGWARLLQPFLRDYVRRQMQRLQLQPVKAEAEAQARQAAEAAAPTVGVMSRDAGAAAEVPVGRPARARHDSSSRRGRLRARAGRAGRRYRPVRPGVRAANGIPGYGDAGDGHAVTPETQFLVGSLSKSFTALAVLQLAEAGRIDLDTPVAVYRRTSPWPTGPRPAGSPCECCSTRPAGWPTPASPN